MKKILFILLLSAFVLPLNAWVFFKGVANPREEASPYLIYNTMQDKPIRICIDFIETSYDSSSRKLKKSYMPSGRKRDSYYRQVADIMNRVYAEWINNVKLNIEKSGRANEFKDLMSYLSSPQITYVNYGSSAKNCDEFPEDNTSFDLRLMAETNDEAKSFIAVRNGHAAYAGGSVRKHIMIFFHPDYIDENWINIYAQKHNDFTDYDVQTNAYNILFKPTLLHEFGHVLGLGDQYLGHEENGDPIYTLSGITSLAGIKSAMQRIERGEKHLVTCDDAEGIINLIDFYSKDASSNRRTVGWASLCRRDVIYMEALPSKVSREEHQAQLNYAANGYEGEIPSHIKRIKAQRQAKIEQEKADAAKAEAEEARAKAEAVKAAVQREMDYNKRLESVGYCPICHKHLANDSLKRISTPRRKITANGQFVKYEYPYGKCTVDVHSRCWEKYKSSGLAVPWKTWCSESKAK